MIKKDIRYILRRILIGVGIAILLMSIKGQMLTDVHAASSSIYLEYDAPSYRLDKDLGNSWANWGRGTLTFPFSMYDSVLPNPGTYTNQIPISVYVTANNGVNYTCNISGVNNTNQVGEINTSGTYGISLRQANLGMVASCDLETGSSGITSVHILGLGGVTTSHWRIYGNLTFITDSTLDVITNQNANNQAIINSNNQINNSINSDDVTTADSTANDFFDDFETSTHGGISGIVTAPLRLVNALYGNSCTPLTIPLPFVNEDISIPCMSSVYQSYFGSFLLLYQLITTGVIGYWVIIKIFGTIRNLVRPDVDKVEVLQL